MKTTGVLSEAFAASISARSRSEIDAVSGSAIMVGVLISFSFLETDYMVGVGRQLSVTNQNSGSPWTPARCMTLRRASDETQALATSAVSKSCQRVTSLGSSTN